jgi:hypothetical protein
MANPWCIRPAERARPRNQGYDAFVPLIDSGISAYVWSAARLLSVLVYSCKRFEPQRAIAYTKQYWRVIGPLEHKEF